VIVIAVQACGVLVFLAGSVGLGRAIRRTDGRLPVARACRLSHALFWGALVAPGLVGVFRPGLQAYDDMLGVPALPPSPLWTVAGAALLLVGVVLMVLSNRALAAQGLGAPSFLLTSQLAVEGVYRRTRNPMSLGFYAAGVGAGLCGGSLAITLGMLLVIAPAHMVNLKYFEEHELILRYGRDYVEYMARVPFLIPRFFA
jgi:protein-S-isoprenylcysteine O-methyltransferase Ste14